jgi:uncharacterized membrane protein
MRIVTYDRQQQRIYVLGQRCHHGATGCALVALGVLLRGRMRPLAALIGGMLVFHDRHDWRAWFVRELYECPEASR